MNRFKTLLVLACLVTPLSATGCDAENEDGVSIEYREQLDAAEILLEDVTDDELDGTIVEAVFEAGVDSGYYDVVSFHDGEEITVSIDARTGERLDEARDRRELRREEADRIRATRRRLAYFIRMLLAERPDERATRVRLRGDEVEVRTLDRRGRVHHYRRRLAAAEDSREPERPEDDREREPTRE